MALGLGHLPEKGTLPFSAETEKGNVPFSLRELGVVPYAEALRRMRELVSQRQAGMTGDTVLLLEHPPVITLGSRGTREHVVDATGVEVHEDVGRGGDVTYHGPGQRVVYPILLLPEGRRDLHRYLRALEDVVIGVLAGFGLRGERARERTGVWVDGAKVAAIGVRAARWVTSHGFALNVTRAVDAGFDRIIPCGLRGARVTSLEALLGAPPAPAAVDALIVSGLRQVIYPDRL